MATFICLHGAGGWGADWDLVAAELGQTRQAIDRYLVAFEHGTLDETLVAERLGVLRDTTRALAARRDELTAALDDGPVAPDPATLDAAISAPRGR